MERLPVYLVLDTSAAMTGYPIETVLTGVNYILDTLRQCQHTHENNEIIYLSVITFDHIAKQIVPLTSLSEFQMPSIQVNGPSALDDALSLLASTIDSEVVKTTVEAKGDWKPLVFFITDGHPTDNWQNGLDEFKKQKKGMVIAFFVSQNADTNVLKQITEYVVNLVNLEKISNAYFKKLFNSHFGCGCCSISELPPLLPELNFVV